MLSTPCSFGESKTTCLPIHLLLSESRGAVFHLGENPKINFQISVLEKRNSSRLLQERRSPADLGLFSSSVSRGRTGMQLLLQILEIAYLISLSLVVLYSTLGQRLHKESVSWFGFNIPSTAFPPRGRGRRPSPILAQNRRDLRNARTKNCAKSNALT